MLGQASLLGTFLSCLAEKDYRADSLIQALFRSPAPLLDEVIIIGTLASFPLCFGPGLASCAVADFGRNCGTSQPFAPNGGCIRYDECPDLLPLTDVVWRATWYKLMN